MAREPRLDSIRRPLSWRPEWEDRVLGGMLGLAVGDALGVPYEFMSKEEVRKEWTGEMVGGGWWNQPPGTWSDDTGQAIALAWAIAQEGPSIEAMARELLAWRRGERHTLGGPPFDVGNTTSEALKNLENGVPPTRSGVDRPTCGSLMRALPVSLYSACLPLEDALELAHAASRITHASPLSEAACGLHAVIVRGLLAGYSLEDSIGLARRVAFEVYARHPRYKEAAFELLARLDPESLRTEPETGSCFAPATLQAALWALLGANSFEEAVARAITLGYDTDTLGAVTGGLAGVIYGPSSIPGRWLEKLRGRDIVEKAARALADRMRRDCG